MTEALPEGSTSAAAAGRQVTAHWSAERSARNLAVVHARRAQRGKLLKIVAGTSALAAAAAALLFVLTSRPSTESAHATSAAAAAPSKVSPRTTFADGSIARVSDGGELIVKAASALHIEAVLMTGAADFEVTKHAERDFIVLAAPVRVRVVGTRFRVERSGERTLVSVSEGKVEVQEGAARTYLEAGESRYFPSTPPLPSALAVAKSEPPAGLPSGARARFLELARGGEFKAAYQVMSQSPTAVGSSAEELMLAADAARLSQHPEQAVGYLRRVTLEHSADSRAPLAAFTLGRVLLSQLSRPGEAADAFALARRLRPAGSLAEDALAREAEARARAGAAGAAGNLARQYVTRYPQGKHLPTMGRLANPQ